MLAQPEFGHILPLLPILDRLRGQGHELIVVATQETRNVIEAPGHKVELWTEDQPVSDAVRSRTGYSFWYEFTQEQKISMRDAVGQRLDALVRRHQPDHFVVDSLFPLSFGIDCSQAPLYGRTTIVGIILPRWDVTLRRMASPLVYLCPAAFEVPAFVIRHPMVHYGEPSCGQMFNVSGDAQEAQTGKPLVLVGFGTQASLQRSFLTRIAAVDQVAADHPDIEFVVALGKSHLEAVSQCGLKTKENVSLRTRVPQRAMLQRASAFITHGGLSSIKEAILTGVPFIVTPEVFDQPFNAMRAEFHGIGSALFHDELSAKSIHSELDGILGRTAKSEKLLQFQELFRQSEAQPRTADIISEHITRQGV